MLEKPTVSGLEPRGCKNIKGEKQRKDDKRLRDESWKLKHCVIPDDRRLALPVITPVVSCQRKSVPCKQHSDGGMY